MENNSKKIIEFELYAEDLNFIADHCNFDEFPDQWIDSIEFNKNLDYIICHCRNSWSEKYEKFLGDVSTHSNNHIILERPRFHNWIQILDEGMNKIEFQSDGSAILSNAKGKFKINSDEIIKFPKKIKYIDDWNEIDSHLSDCIIDFLDPNYSFFDLKWDLEDYILELYRDNDEYRYDKVEFDRYEFFKAYMERKYKYLNKCIKNLNDENEVNRIKSIMESIEKRQDKFNLYLP
jgi:hypothetical protein